MFSLISSRHSIQNEQQTEFYVKPKMYTDIDKNSKSNQLTLLIRHDSISLKHNIALLIIQLLMLYRKVRC